jgi:hypothetical protein
MDTSAWDPGTYDISIVSAQEDTVVHIGYIVVQIEAVVYDDVQWHAREFISTTENGQSGVLDFEECVDEDSIVDISRGSREVAFQQDSVQE